MESNNQINLADLIDKLRNIVVTFEIFFKEIYRDENVTEIAINDYGSFWYEKNNVWKRQESKEITPQSVSLLVNQISSCTGRKYSGSTSNHITINSLFSCALDVTYERIQVVAPPIVNSNKYSITIRKPSRTILPLSAFDESTSREKFEKKRSEKTKENNELESLYKSCTNFNEFLLLAVKYRKNIIISGGTGSGKTTLMKSLMQEADASDRIVTIEDAPELVFPNHDNLVQMFYESEAVKGGELVTSQNLLKSCLRMKPDRILLAEIRGGEALDFLNIISTGHGGSITSLHAEDVYTTFTRLKGMALTNEDAVNLDTKSIMQLMLNSIDVIVNITNDHGERYIKDIYFKDVDMQTYIQRYFVECSNV